MAYSLHITDNADTATATVTDISLTNLKTDLEGQGLSISPITGDTTITSANASNVLQVNKGTNVTLTLPNSLPKGFAFIVDQVGAGLALFVAASGASIVNRSGFDRTAGAGAMMNAYVRSNSNGASAVWVLGGDGATA